MKQNLKVSTKEEIATVFHSGTNLTILFEEKYQSMNVNIRSHRTSFLSFVPSPSRGNSGPGDEKLRKSENRNL